MKLLGVDHVTKKYGGLTANDDISFTVNEGEILSVIGPNGAGKSTLFKMIGGFVKPTSGTIEFQGRNITALPAYKVAALGIARTFQETTIFKEMTAREHVQAAHHLSCRAGMLGQFVHSPQARRDARESEDNANRILDFLGLGAVRDELAVNLPHGHLRALGIAMGMAVKPKLLLLDEPFAGMNSEETNAAMLMVRKIAASGITILLVEHDMHAVMRLSDRIVVLNFGARIAEGTPAQIQSDTRVIEAYLGQEDEALGI